MTPSEIIRQQAEAGYERAQREATHIWPRAKPTPTPTPTAPQPQPQPDPKPAPAALNTIESRVLQALNQRAGRWFTVEELVIATKVRRSSLSPTLTRLVARNPGVVRVQDSNGKSFLYRLINSLPRGKK